MTHGTRGNRARFWIERIHDTAGVQRLFVRLIVLCFMAGSGFLTGCGYGGVPLDGSINPTASTNNWELKVTPKAGTDPTKSISLLSGSILTSSSGPNATKAAAVFQVVSGCFADPNVLSMDGAITNNHFNGRSFGVNGQFLTLIGDLDDTQANLTGTYSVGGGCADGQSGTISGARFNALTGTYRGTTSGTTPHTISIVTTQGSATGVGNFLVSGTATFDAFACFGPGTFSIQKGAVSGSSVDLSVDLSGTPLELVGSIERTATTMSIPKFTVCGVDFSPLTLTRQP